MIGMLTLAGSANLTKSSLDLTPCVSVLQPEERPRKNGYDRNSSPKRTPTFMSRDEVPGNTTLPNNGMSLTEW